MSEDDGVGLVLDLDWDQDDEPTQEHQYTEMELRFAAGKEDT